jgi:hypothetical protein
MSLKRTIVHMKCTILQMCVYMCMHAYHRRMQSQGGRWGRPAASERVMCSLDTQTRSPIHVELQLVAGTQKVCLCVCLCVCTKGVCVCLSVCTSGVSGSVSVTGVCKLALMRCVCGAYTRVCIHIHRYKDVEAVHVFLFQAFTQVIIVNDQGYTRNRLRCIRNQQI